MKKHLLIAFVAILTFIVPASGQMALDHAFAKPLFTDCEVVNLSRSGKKIVTVNTASLKQDTIFFYNMDYSFWKWIICPAIPGKYGQFNFTRGVGVTVGIYYPSEELFNTDTLLEAAVIYLDTITDYETIYVINENSVFTDSINNVYGFQPFNVYEVDTSGVFKASAITSTGVNIYTLPGSLPCNSCAGGGRTAEVEKTNERNTIDTHFMPNPSTDKVKITFTLPEGVNQANLCLYNTNGQLLKTYTVDNKFGFITIDNSALMPGLYFYNIEVNGIVSSTQKMVVLK